MTYPPDSYELQLLTALQNLRGLVEYHELAKAIGKSHLDQAPKHALMSLVIDGCVEMVDGKVRLRFEGIHAWCDSEGWK